MKVSAVSKTFTRFAWAVLAFTVAVVLWGAYVRATGAGAGCGNHWPLCNGEVVPRAPAVKTIIEFTHRVMSGLDGLLIFLLVIWALRAYPPRHLARKAAAASFVFVITEALIGAALVKLEHVAQNTSLGRVWSLSGHLMNTLTLLACLALTAFWGNPRQAKSAADPQTGPPVPPAKAPVSSRGPSVWAATPGLLLFVLTGISGAIAALGDTLFPAASLAAGFRQDFDPAANVLLRMRWFHPFLAIVAGTFLSFYATRIETRLPAAKPYARMLLSAVGLQIGAGVLNLLLLAPVWMQILHLLLADLLWISVVLLAACTLQQFGAAVDSSSDEMAPGIASVGGAGSR
jgi:heme A synthase